jgi:hypothetical protein
VRGRFWALQGCKREHDHWRDAVRGRIVGYGCANIVVEIVPLGCTMTGKWRRKAYRRLGPRATVPTGDDG